VPIQIVEKEKTKPTCPNRHKDLVPLRVVTVRFGSGWDEKDARWERLQQLVEIGDIIFVGGVYYGELVIFNCTKQRPIDTRWNENILCVRAYDIAQIVLCNDSEPAPVL